MRKKKNFKTTDLTIPEVQKHAQLHDPSFQNLVGNPVIDLPPNPSARSRLSFASWYGRNIDAITHICHVQTLRFLAKQDADLEISTICGAYEASKKFLDYAELLSTALDRELTLDDINRELIDGFLTHLSTQDYTANSQRITFSFLKTLLLPPGRRGIYKLVTQGAEKTFRDNPFPESQKQTKSAQPLSKKEKQSVIIALRSEINPIWNEGYTLTSELLTYCLFIVALHTGRNTTPLLEMTPNCLRPHPKDDTYFLVLWKRRGHNSNKVILRSDVKATKPIESMPSINFNVERLIRQVISRTAPARSQNLELRDRIWIFQSRAQGSRGGFCCLGASSMQSAIGKLIRKHNILDDNGTPLKLNISRLRKTFANRIFEILDGNIASTARALGHTARVSEQNYLAAPAESKKNWRFMGEILVDELLHKSIGETYHTPIAKCSNHSNDLHTEPKHQICTTFINCLRCKSFVVTADDLYKLFSFYYRIFLERTKMSKRRWEKELSHIPRLIDNYVITEGLRRGIFKQSQIDDAKNRARTCPHPFWSADLTPSIEAYY